MSLELINNGDTGLQARTKINAAITALNNILNPIREVTFYGSSFSPVGEINDTAACEAYPAGTQYTLYFGKGSGNTSEYLESGDTIYTDSAGTTVLPVTTRYFGYYDSVNFATKYVFIGASQGVVTQITTCTPAPSYTAITIYDNSPTPTGVDDSTTACNAYPMGNQHTVYWNQQSSFPTSGDVLYLDSNGSNPLNTPGKYYGFYSVALAQTRYILMGNTTPGGIQSSDSCAAPEPGLTIYSSMVASLMPFADSSSACSGIANNFTFSVYITKDPANMDPNNIEVGDTLYSDSAKTTPLSSGWWGWNYTAINYSFEVDSFGTVQNKNNC